jgi:ribose 5-phosphate isomerase B
MTTIAFGCDHAGFALKLKLIEAAREMGLKVLDLGASSATESVDYPDFAAMVTQAIQDGRANIGVLSCGTGIGMSIAANRHPGIRAALCHTELEARLARTHNHANILCLGGRIIGVDQAQACFQVFLTSTPEEGRHEHRVAKMG